MAVSLTLDITYRVNNELAIEVSGWDYVVIHLINGGSGATFYSSNDSGSISGVSDGNADTAINFHPISGLALADYTYQINGTDGLFKFEGVGQFLLLSGGNFEKVIARLYKI